MFSAMSVVKGNLISSQTVTNHVAKIKQSDSDVGGIIITYKTQLTKQVLKKNDNNNIVSCHTIMGGGG